ncbi:hypothetical protein D9M69_548720 [compost metagenome]
MSTAPATLAGGRIAMATSSTTGISSITRNTLITVALSAAAVSPAFDSIMPAATTWATSWMVAPKNTPACAGVRPIREEARGYSTIARVDNSVTPTTASSVKRSFSRVWGSTEETASAAEAPQMPTAQPETRPSATGRRSR